MLNIDDISRVFANSAAHINRAGANCCKGCTLARQIPTLTEEIRRLRALTPDCTCLDPMPLHFTGPKPDCPAHGHDHAAATVLAVLWPDSDQLPAEEA